jgi:hypothetical protein
MPERLSKSILFASGPAQANHKQEDGDDDKKDDGQDDSKDWHVMPPLTIPIPFTRLLIGQTRLRPFGQGHHTIILRGFPR